MNSHAEDSPPLRRAAVLLALAGFCLYLPTLFHSFFADDHIYLSFKNRLLRDTGWADAHRLLFERANPWEYLPLRDLSYWLDFRIYETEGMGFHFSNLLWYALAALAAGLLFREVVLLFRRDLSPHATTLAWCGVALFIVHPVHVEAVAWVASRKDLMSATFAFASALVLTRGMRYHWPVSAAALSALLLFAACFSKAAGATMVLFECALILAAWRFAPEIPTRRKLLYLALLLATAVLAAFVHMKIGQATGIRIENTPPPGDVIERASRIFAALMRLLAAPYPLGLYHDVYAQGNWHWIVSAGGMAMLLITAATLAIRPTLWAFGAILVIAPCTIYLQFTPFTTWSLASERFVFMSVAGLSMILMDICARISWRRALLLLCLLTLVCAALTWQRVGEWEFTSPLREQEYTRQPAFHNAIRDQFINVLHAGGETAEAERLARSVERPYARDVLLALIIANTALRQAATQPPPAQEMRATILCPSFEHLRNKLNVAYAAMRTEPDLSYNNLLISVEEEIRTRRADIEKHCGPDVAGPKR
jgi:hypothetical protein